MDCSRRDGRERSGAWHWALWEVSRKDEWTLSVVHPVSLAPCLCGSAGGYSWLHDSLCTSVCQGPAAGASVLLPMPPRAAQAPRPPRCSQDWTTGSEWPRQVLLLHAHLIRSHGRQEDRKTLPIHESVTQPVYIYAAHWLLRNSSLPRVTVYNCANVTKTWNIKSTWGKDSFHRLWGESQLGSTLAFPHSTCIPSLQSSSPENSWWRKNVLNSVLQNGIIRMAGIINHLP